MLKKYLHTILLLFILQGCSKSETILDEKVQPSTNDSISIWIKESQTVHINDLAKLELLQKAVQYAAYPQSDTIKAKYYTQLSYDQNFTFDSTLFREVNKNAIKFNQKIKDSLSLGNAYWDLAFFYNNYAIQDSAYYAYNEAQKIFEGISQVEMSGRMFLEMAKIQTEIKDYIGSESTVIKAIEQFKQTDNTLFLYHSYNLLGISSGSLGEVEKSLAYYNEALYYLNQLNFNNYEEAQLLNNIGVVYRDNKDYNKAIENFNKVLTTNEILQKNPKLYAIALSNLATSRLYKNDTAGVNSLFIKAINLKTNLNQKTSLATSYHKYAEYKAYAKDTATAIINAKKAENLSLESENNETLLQTWSLLATLDKKNSIDYFEKYIQLDDSLQKEERKQQNKFARIRFETDEFIAENVELESEKNILSRQRSIWIAIAGGLFLLGLSIYIIITQRAKNQKLRFDQQQQANNQEIFNLMLTQKQKVDEVKRLEQKRISEELHDGVLGKMLGARMILTGLNKRVTEEAIAEKSKALGSLQEIENEIRSISHELSHTAYQKINNFTDSIESLLDAAKRNVAINTFFKFNEDEDWDSLDGDIKINAYRIIQETFQNAIKHAQCSIFEITFLRTDDEFKIIMSDNGVGFKNVKGKKGIGIRNITSRINKLNGTWNIESAKGKGTTITLRIPIKNKSNNFDDNNTRFENV
ncbi:Signal transduction histidine kinase [Maribacter sedimenticola]|uniref:histidine kinase n=1 Tax=Maribacter sedimenticola TaxID=228956 RepID=A0ABY1SG86_9FLAO|nr:ATP-binding protein [Maribacter sedimenticola]SNR44425.1 Signal transduction histidine kinase [Maribacter sedimenticola]